MKKLIFILMSLFLVINICAVEKYAGFSTKDDKATSTIFFEGFEGTWPPSGWNFDSDWERKGELTVGESTYPPYEGEYWLYCPWKDQPSEQWAYTPNINIAGKESIFFEICNSLQWILD